MNPYTNRVTIRNPENFFNRKVEVNRIFSRIGGIRPQSICIVGERRVGKSSLLYYVCNEHVGKKFLEEFETYIFVFCDLQQKSDMDVDGFFTFATKEIAELWGVSVRATRMRLSKMLSSKMIVRLATSLKDPFALYSLP